MKDHVEVRAPQRQPASTPPSALFAWSGGGIVLLGERVDAGWALARGWREGDRLIDVRRWSFADPRAFAGQVRRLVRDASGDPAAARQAGADATDWIAVHATPASKLRDRGLMPES